MPIIQAVNGVVGPYQVKPVNQRDPLVSAVETAYTVRTGEAGL